MSPGLTERWDAKPGATAGSVRFVRNGRPDLVEQWVPGLVKPTEANTGPANEGSLANYAGSFTNAKPGDVIKDLIVRDGIVLNQSNVTVRNCLVLNSRRSTYTPSVPGQTPTVMLGISCLTAGVTGLVVEDTAIRVPPAERTFDTYGVQGRNVTLRRCEIAGVVDGVVAHGSTTVRGYYTMEGCYIHDLPHYSYDPRQTDGSHNDGNQLEGALTVVRIVGNTILGGYTSAILITQNVAHPDDYDRITITDNWLDLEGFGGSVVNLTEKGRGVVSNYTLARNKFGRVAWNQGRPLILTDALTKAAGTTYMPTTGPNANVFEAVGDSLDGKPVPLGFYT